MGYCKARVEYEYGCNTIITDDADDDDDDDDTTNYNLN